MSEADACVPAEPYQNTIHRQKMQALQLLEKCQQQRRNPPPTSVDNGSDHYLTRRLFRDYRLVLAREPCPHSLVAFIGVQPHTKARATDAGVLDETIGKYHKEKKNASATRAAAWVFISHRQPLLHRERCNLLSKRKAGFRSGSGGKKQLQTTALGSRRRFIRRRGVQALSPRKTTQGIAHY